MNDRQRENAATVACRICGKQIQRSAARTAEGRDYTYFFCGEGCFQRWAANERVDRETPERRP